MARITISAEQEAGVRLTELGVDFVREHRFAPPRRWRFDFALIAERIAIEVEGGTWSQGRHNRPQGYQADCEKYNAAAVMGWRVLRFTPAMVRRGDLEQSISAITTHKKNFIFGD